MLWSPLPRFNDDDCNALEVAEPNPRRPPRLHRLLLIERHRGRRLDGHRSLAPRDRARLVEALAALCRAEVQQVEEVRVSGGRSTLGWRLVAN